MAERLGLGDTFNVVSIGDNAAIDMSQAEAATFVAFLGAGNHSVSIEEGVDNDNYRALPAIDLIHKAPGDGSGTWTEVTQTAAATYAATDAANDCIAITIFAKTLSDGYNTVRIQNTANFGSVYLTGLNSPRDPDSLPSPLAG